MDEDNEGGNNDSNALTRGSDGGSAAAPRLELFPVDEPPPAPPPSSFSYTFGTKSRSADEVRRKIEEEERLRAQEAASAFSEVDMTSQHQEEEEKEEGWTNEEKEEEEEPETERHDPFSSQNAVYRGGEGGGRLRGGGGAGGGGAGTTTAAAGGVGGGVANEGDKLSPRAIPLVNNDEPELCAFCGFKCSSTSRPCFSSCCVGLMGRSTAVREEEGGSGQEERKRKNLSLLLLAALGFVLIAVGGTVGGILGSSNGGGGSEGSPGATPPTSPPPAELTQQGTIDDLRILLQTNSPDGGKALSNPNSVQHSAMEWLYTSNPKLYQTYDTNRKIQRYALVTMYYSWNGIRWTNKNNNNWLRSDDECTWEGVHCLGGVGFVGRVTHIHLAKNGLVGNLVEEIVMMKDTLKELDLSDNLISGQIPVKFDLLSELRLLHLHSTDITGSVPQSICSLRKQKYLESLSTDCAGINPEVTCALPDCCTECFQ